MRRPSTKAPPSAHSVETTATATIFAVVVHAEHHEARPQHDAEWEAHDQQCERDQLPPERRQETDDGSGGDADREDGQHQDEGDGAHPRSR